MITLKFRFLWSFIGYGLIGLVVVLSLSPSLPLAMDFFWEDKLYHLLAYAVLMLWFAQLHPRSRYGWLVCGFIALGILLEGLQSQTSIRNGDVWDVAANSLGVILSWRLALTKMNTLLYQFEVWCLKPENEI
jgi:glycopeptide antibiotics resistance protein